MRCVVVESPLRHRKGDVEAFKLKLRYLRAALRDCLMRGESPYASHGLLAQPGVLDDSISEQREHGIEAGFAWGERADACVVYQDLGISDGMERGIERAVRLGQPVDFRKVPGWAET